MQPHRLVIIFRSLPVLRPHLSETLQPNIGTETASKWTNHSFTHTYGRTRASSHPFDASLNPAISVHVDQQPTRPFSWTFDIQRVIPNPFMLQHIEAHANEILPTCFSPFTTSRTGTRISGFADTCSTTTRYLDRFNLTLTASYVRL